MESGHNIFFRDPIGDDRRRRRHQTIVAEQALGASHTMQDGQERQKGATYTSDTKQKKHTQLLLPVVEVLVLVGTFATAGGPYRAAALGAMMPVLSVFNTLICRLDVDGQAPRKNVTVSRSRSPSSLADESSRPPRQLFSR
uniref:Uncharacterized protein n=1 Tax=Anopheles farauti TaxID=69004 RepID=A0A182QA20_9DIPT